MEREILITDLTAMGGDKVCIAGIDRQWNTIRPVFPWPDIPTRRVLRRGRQVRIRPRAVVMMLLEPLAATEAPHVEDWLWTRSHAARPLQILEDERWQRVLQTLAEDCPRPLFGAALQSLGRDRNRIILPGKATHSLATVHCARKMDFRLRERDRGGFRFALSFYDDKGEVYQNIPVTDLALREWAYAGQRRGAEARSLAGEVTAKLNAADEVYLRLGLGREYEGKFWLQVNGIYSFPDWLGGRCFADFDAARA